MLSPLLLLGLAALSSACEVCDGSGDVQMVRNVRRMQPDSQNAVTKPKGPLEWGQVNFLHTTDTHGWLSGHIKEGNYGADWGDYVSFIRHMRYKARSLDVDLLIVDTGDLHDGNGLSDATAEIPGHVNGEVSNPIFENLDYDLLTIGNHELYVSDIAYETFNEFANKYGSRYITSNVQILNPKTGKYEYVGKQYRYFQTPKGINIMALGVLFDFTGNSNASIVTPAATMIQQDWFKQILNFDKPIDMFVVVGHNPARGSGSTFPLLHTAIRNAYPNTPVQFFGGHFHIRDFATYDNTTTALASGRYCETLGWLSMSGVKAGTGCLKPKGVPNPSRPALNSTAVTKDTMVYARRYLDWNRLTFSYHADNVKTFDVPRGKAVTHEITGERERLNLTTVYGCAPQSYCMSCVPQTSNSSVFPLVQTALAATVINASRADNSRMIIINSGSIRFDLVAGPFTYDDSFIVSPFKNTFNYLPNVPYKYAVKILALLNAGPNQKRHQEGSNLVERYVSPRTADACPLDNMGSFGLLASGLTKRRVITKRQEVVVPGYTTTDDFGIDGDDTPHSTIPSYPVTNDIQATANFPADGKDPETVDLIFLSFISTYILTALQQAGVTYSLADVGLYLPESFSTNTYLPAYAKIAWKPTC